MSVEWGTEETQALMQEIYGRYQITKFLPTKYYAEETTYYHPPQDRSGCEILPVEEACLMLRQTVVISEDLFVTYDNYRQPDCGRKRNGSYRLDKAEIENPDYRVKNARAETIYGIRDGILSDELTQESYVEIDVYPGYDVNGCKNLPQMYLTEDSRIIMYSMGEYFLLEKIDEQNDGNEAEDLSSWIGRYAFSEKDSGSELPFMFWDYSIDIYKNEMGDYYADIIVFGRQTCIKIRAEIYGNNEEVSFKFYDCLPGNGTWKEKEPDEENTLLSFHRDLDTGDIYTYWGAIKALQYENQESGKIYFCRQ